MRYQQCMTRATTLIKMYFVGSLRALTQDVSRWLFEQVRYGDVYLFIACLSLHRTSLTRPKYISYKHASQRYLGRFLRSSESSNVAPVRTPTSWDSYYPSAMQRTLAHARICSFRVLLSRSADLFPQEQCSSNSYVFLLACSP